METLIPGQNCRLLSSNIVISANTNRQADYSAYILYNNGKIKADDDFIFYGNKQNINKSIQLKETDSGAEFYINLKNLPSDAKKIVFAITVDNGTISSLNNIILKILQKNIQPIACEVVSKDRDEVALILGEIYIYNDTWKFRFVSQGYKGGLKMLAESLGVEISEDSDNKQLKSDLSKENNLTNEKVNLSKITLTKTAPLINLQKQDITKSIYKINLNWNQLPVKKVKFLDFLLGENNSIDLDLAAYIRLKDGSQTIIQALNKYFGDLDRPPYVKLLGDDRTGEQIDGEWIEINGKYIDKIEEIIIFTFIYEGVANWKETDAKVTLYISGFPPVETLLTEGDDALGLCAIARISNHGNQLKIERLNQYFSGHEEMDEEYGWGFSWTEGYK